MLRQGQATLRALDYFRYRIGYQREATQPGVRENQPVIQNGFTLRQIEALSKIDDGNNPAMNIDYAQYNAGRVRQRSDLGHSRHAVYGRQMQRVALVIQSKNEKLVTHEAVGIKAANMIVMGLRNQPRYGNP
jgi:hypothetical protein